MAWHDRHLTEFNGLDLEMTITDHYNEVIVVLHNTFKVGTWGPFAWGHEGLFSNASNRIEPNRTAPLALALAVEVHVHVLLSWRRRRRQRRL